MGEVRSTTGLQARPVDSASQQVADLGEQRPMILGLLWHYLIRVRVPALRFPPWGSGYPLQMLAVGIRIAPPRFGQPSARRMAEWLNKMEAASRGKP